MDDKRKPMRTCIVCRNKRYKSELIRVVPDGDKMVPDGAKVLPGRGAYICNDISCLDKLIKTKALDRAYRRQFSEKVYTDLRDACLNTGIRTE